jgi:hypothetical protein
MKNVIHQIRTVTFPLTTNPDTIPNWCGMTLASNSSITQDDVKAALILTLSDIFHFPFAK